MRRIISFLFACATLMHLHAQSIEFKSIEQALNDLDAQKYPIHYGEGNSEKTCALVKVQLPIKDVVFENDFIIGVPQYKVNEYWVYMADGAAKLDVKHPDCQKLSISFGIKLESKMTYILKLNAVGIKAENKVMVRQADKEEVKEVPQTPIKVEQRSEDKKATTVKEKPQEKIKPIKEPKKVKEPYVPKDFSMYFGPQFQPLSFMGIGGMAGVYIKHFNAELEYTAGMSKSEEIFWNNTSLSSTSSYSYEYSPSSLGVYLGYAVVDARSFRLTPQLGIGSVMLKGKEASKGTNDPNATSGYAVTARLGASADIRFSRNFGIFLTPQFCFALSKSDLFQRVADVSSKVKGYATGFNAKLGFYLEF